MRTDGNFFAAVHFIFDKINSGYYIMNETNTPTSRLAVLSLVAATLTVLSFCGGIAPIPLTGWVCFPTAIFFGAAALGSGVAALSRMRTSGKRGHEMAHIGAWTGGLTILATICAVALTASFFAALADQIWKQIQP